MIQRLVGICLVLGVSTAGPLRKWAYAPAPPGGRPTCAAKSITFCEEVDKYPTKLIQKLLHSKSFDMYDFFTDESEGLGEPPEYVLQQDMLSPDVVEIKKRRTRSVEEPPEYVLQQDMLSPDAVERKERRTRSVDTILYNDKFSRVCSVKSKTAAPKLASNRKGEWKFIAQDEKSKSQQKFKVQICSDSEECQKSCTQFYTAVPMLSVDPTGKLSDDNFWMPSTCRCFDDFENMM